MASKAVFLFTLVIFFASTLTSSSSSVLFPLTHTLARSRHVPVHQLLKSATESALSRFRIRHRRQQASLPLSQGSDYILSLTINTSPPQSVSLYMDTGSDLVWFPCQPFDCVLCEDKQPPHAAPPVNLSSTASKLHCKSPSCSAVHSKLPSSDLCAISGCPLVSIETSDCISHPCPPFYYAYGDGSLVGQLFLNSVKLPSSGSPLVIRNFTFGCSHSALGEPIGVAGFGQGLLSLPAQLAAGHPQLGGAFSYCLVSHTFNSSRTSLPSPLILGRYTGKTRRPNDNDRFTSDDKNFVFTPVLENPANPYFYVVGLEEISVGEKTIPAPEFLKLVDRQGTGGMVVDSGTTFTLLPSEMYNSVVASFHERLASTYERASMVEDNTGLSPCYYSDDSFILPEFAFSFSGNSKVMLPKENYFYEFIDGSGKGTRRKVGCLMVMNGGDEKELIGGPGATLGNYQQQGFEVVYDLVEKRIGFARRRCESLWKRLNGRR